MVADSQPIDERDPIPLASGEYWLVLRALPDPVVAIDAGGLVDFANDAAEQLFGNQPGGLNGRPLGDLVDGELNQTGPLGGLAGRRTRVRSRLRDGRQLELEMVVGLLPAPGGDLAVACFRECKELERQAAAARYMRTAARAAALVSARLDLEHVLATVADALTQDLEAALARVWLVEDGTALRVRASAGRAKPDGCLGELIALGEPSPIGQVALARLPIVKADLATDPRFPRRWLLEERISSGAILPLTLGRELHGVLACFFHEPPADELVEVLFTFAAMVAASVGDINQLKREQAARAAAEAAQRRLLSEGEADRSRARALALANEALSAQHEELENARRRLAAQHAVLQALASCATLEQAAPRVLEAIGTSMGWDVGTLWLPDAREASLRPAEIWVAPSTEPRDFIARARRVGYAVGEGLVGRVFQTGEPAWMDDATKSSAFRRAELAAAAGLHGAVWFPIRHGSEVYGVVEFFRRDQTTPDDETLLAIGALGRQIGQFIERVRAQSALQSSEERLATTLRSIGDAVVATDAEGRVEYMNPVAEALTGWRSDEARGRLLEEAVRFVDARTREPESCWASGTTAKRPRVELAANTLLIGRDGSEIIVEKSVGPILGARGEPVGVVLVFRDVTEKWRAEARGRFLSEASGLLASSLDYEATLSEIARVAVPSIADWCAVELLEGDSLRSLVICGADPVATRLAQAARQRFEPETCRAFFAASPLCRGEALLYSRLDERSLASVARDPDHLDLLCRLNLRSALVAPVTARGRPQGALVFASTEPVRFDSADISMAQELGRR
ncbi:MAG: GAF domain-containing protein, partial [Myxococcales bacterium]